MRMADRSSEPSGWAVGWTYFAGMMMILIGFFHVIAGFVAIVNDQFYVATEEYIFQFDTSTWGWIHLILGIVVLLAGFGLFSGSVAARTVGTIVALLSAIAAFAWLPYFPVWAIVIIAAAVSVIWALTAHGRDVTRY
jgi:vacuolar-type H+-ATPase subunit I/STV1